MYDQTSSFWQPALWALPRPGCCRPGPVSTRRASAPSPTRSACPPASPSPSPTGTVCKMWRSVIPRGQAGIFPMSEPEIKLDALRFAQEGLKVSFVNTSLMKFTWPGSQAARAGPRIRPRPRKAAGRGKGCTGTTAWRICSRPPAAPRSWAATRCGSLPAGAWRTPRACIAHRRHPRRAGRDGGARKGLPAGGKRGSQNVALRPNWPSS